jgi:ketosteroid isomerase-like protein
MPRSAQFRASLLAAASLLTCFVVAVDPQPVLAAGNHSEKKHDAKREVELLEEQWRMAQLASDAATMDKLLSDDFIGISMSGQVSTKAQQLDRVRSHKLMLSKIELSDRKVKLIGGIAIVTSRAEVEGTNETGPVKGTFRYTRVYKRLPSGGWKITSFEATRIPSAKTSSNDQRAAKPLTASPTSDPRFN